MLFSISVFVHFVGINACSILAVPLHLCCMIFGRKTCCFVMLVIEGFTWTAVSHPFLGDLKV